MFTPPQSLENVARSQLVSNHQNRQLPLKAIELLRKGGHYNTLDRNGDLRVGYGDLYRRTIALGTIDPSLALVDSMHHVAAALIADPSVPQEQRAYIAGVVESKIMAAFISGRFTRSEAGLPSFLTDVRAKQVEQKGMQFWQINGTKGVATNAEGCDYALVTFKDESDKSPGGSLFGLVKMRDGSGNPAPGIKIYDTGHTLGVPSTRSCSVEFKNVRVPAELVLPWNENALGHFLGKNGKAAFGVYTGAYVGTCKRVLSFLQKSKAKYKSLVKQCSDAVHGAEQTLLKAADLIDRGAPLNETMPLLLVAKQQAGLASTELIAAMSKVGGFHDFSWDSENDELIVFLLALFMANAHPPSTPMIEDIMAGRIVLPL